MLRQIESESSVNLEFPHMVHVGLLHIIIDSFQDSSPIRSFLDAYQYRSQRFWLHESGNLPGEPDGLQAALKSVLRSYLPRLATVDAPPPTGVATAYEETDPPKVNFQDVKRLERVAQSISEDKRSVEWFGQSLSRKGHDPATLSQNEINYHLLQALDYYVQNYKRGTSTPDPW